ELCNLPGPHRACIDFQDIDRPAVLCPEGVDADDRIDPAIDSRLRAGCGLLDPAFRKARRDGFCYASRSFDLINMGQCPLSESAREIFDIIRAAPGIGDMRSAAFLLQEELGVAGDPR